MDISSLTGKVVKNIVIDISTTIVNQDISKILISDMSKTVANGCVRKKYGQ